MGQLVTMQRCPQSEANTHQQQKWLHARFQRALQMYTDPVTTSSHGLTW